MQDLAGRVSEPSFDLRKGPIRPKGKQLCSLVGGSGLS